MTPGGPINLDMIGETPNPDDEETFRNQIGGFGGSSNKHYMSSAKHPAEFIIEEEPHGEVFSNSIPVR